MEIILTLGAWILGGAAAIVTIWKAIEPISKFWTWLRSWKLFIKRREYDQLKTIETEHQKCEAKYNKVKSELDGLYKTCAPYLAQQRKELVQSFVGPAKIEADFDPREPVSKY